jgi:phenylalanyl-tRNA synthetase beta chain
MVGAKLPNGLEIKVGKIRDVESQGMLCSESELGFAEESEGIIILPADAPLGAPLAQFLGREDTVFTINVTPNRGDALSIMGVARELASILGQPLKAPVPKLAEQSAGANLKIRVQVEDGSGCLQYHGRYIEGVKVAPSPAWMQRRLEASGVRAINNVVDVTNYVLLELGVPLHAFDYDLLANDGGMKTIRARRAHAGDKLPLLDGTEAKLVDADLVISDSEKAIALAGVMGGANSEVSDKTTKLVLEAAEFHYATVRADARRHGKHTEASHRYERRIDPLMVARASDRAASLIAELTGGKVHQGRVSAFARGHEDQLRALKDHAVKVPVSVERFNAFVGGSFKAEEVAAALKAAGFPCEGSAAHGNIVASPASHRPDVVITEDFYEEALRVLGFERIAPRMPKLSDSPGAASAHSSPVVARNRALQKIRGALATLGFNECVNYGFTSRARAEDWLYDKTQAGKLVGLRNPLNEEFTTMKPSLLGGLFDNMVTALRHQQKEVRLFELRPVFLADEKSDTGVAEEWRLAVLMTGRASVTGLAAQDRAAGFFDVKGVLESLMDTLGARGLRVRELKEAGTGRYPQFHPFQSVELALGPGPCGVLGRIHPTREAAAKVRQPVLAFELSVDRLLDISKSERKYAALPTFPRVERDFSFVVPDATSSATVLTAVQKLGKPLVEGVQVIDVFAGGSVPAGHRSLTFTVTMGAADRTLEETDIAAASQKLVAGLQKELGLQLRAE